MKTACFIPIKANSERVPGKNLRVLNGKRLQAHGKALRKHLGYFFLYILQQLGLRLFPQIVHVLEILVKGAAVHRRRGRNADNTEFFLVHQQFPVGVNDAAASALRHFGLFVHC